MSQRVWSKVSTGTELGEDRVGKDKGQIMEGKFSTSQIQTFSFYDGINGSQKGCVLFMRQVMGMNTGEYKYRIGPFAVPLQLE